jgi:hypothetical protein
VEYIDYSSSLPRYSSYEAARLGKMRKALARLRVGAALISCWLCRSADDALAAICQAKLMSCIIMYVKIKGKIRRKAE